MAGKANWLAFGLPSEGKDSAAPRAADVARRDVPICGPDDRLGSAREQARAQGWDECLVVNGERIVLGRLRFDRLDAAPAAVVAHIMERGPTTIRPNERLAALAPRLQKKHVERIVVTTPDGRLVGVVDRRDVEARLGAAPREPAGDG
ncbi:MAG TPA: CBS domain-containing protein [Thermomicrobiales bacterium]|nr:CBS domain-containing protein [Thermomicrobiales bacterium]